MMGHDSHRVSPFRNHRIVGCLAPPRCLSQLTASFIASQRQGIHLLPLISYFSSNFTIPFPFPYSIVNEQHPPVFPTGATRPCLDDCREIFASMTNHGLYVSKLVVNSHDDKEYFPEHNRNIPGLSGSHNLMWSACGHISVLQ